MAEVCCWINFPNNAPSLNLHFSPRPNPPDLVEMVPASPWGSWGPEYPQPPPPPAFASPVEAEIALTGAEPANFSEEGEVILFLQAISWTQNLNLGSTKTTPKTTLAFQRTTRASRKITHPFQKITHPSQKSTLAYQKTMRACRRSTWARTTRRTTWQGGWWRQVTITS